MNLGPHLEGVPVVGKGHNVGVLEDLLVENLRITGVVPELDLAGIESDLGYPGVVGSDVTHASGPAGSRLVQNIGPEIVRPADGKAWVVKVRWAGKASHRDERR